MTTRFKRYWIFLGVVFIASFAVLGLLGGEIYQQAPPEPDSLRS